MDSTNGEPPQKKAKCDEVESIHDSLETFKDFTVDEILNENPDSKRIVVKGRFSDRDGFAIIVMEKTPFVVDNIKSVLTESTTLEKTFGNDIYGNYNSYLPAKYNGVKTIVIHPATQKHVEKYQKQEFHIVDETPELYNNVTLPYLQKSQFNIQWVYNILNHSCESERIVYEDSEPEVGFVLLPDLKWDGVIMENLYLLAIASKNDIKSLRDLNKEHLPLLYNIKKKGLEAIKSKYGISSDSLRIYLHYQPSYYHLHVHFSHVRFTPPGIVVPHAVLLTTVISNIELMADYYQKTTLPFLIRENDLLYQQYVTAGVLPNKQNDESK